jgi:hypothetical protein
MTSVPRIRRLALALAFVTVTFAPIGRAWAEHASDHPQPLPNGILVPDDDIGAASPLVARARGGKVVVRNRTGGYTIDVYLAPDDGVTKLQYVNTIPTGFRLILRGVPRRINYQLYGEDPGAQVFWGPRSFFMRRRFVWTLLP